MSARTLNYSIFRDFKRRGPTSDALIGVLIRLRQCANGGHWSTTKVTKHMNRIKTSNVGRVRGFRIAGLMMGALLIAVIPSCQNLPSSDVVEVTPATDAFEVSPGAPVVKITTLSAPATARTSDRVTFSLATEDIEVSSASAPKVIQLAGTLEVDILVSPVGADACAEGMVAAAFDVAVDNGVPVSVNPPVVQAPDAAAAVLAQGDAVLCTSISADFSASVIIRRLNVAFETDAGNTNGNGNSNQNDNGGDSGSTNDNMNANGDDDNGGDNSGNGNDNMNDDGDDDNGNNNGDDDNSNENMNNNENSDDSNGNDNLNDNGNSNDNMNDNGDDDNGHDNDNMNDNGDGDSTNDNGNANSG